MDTSLEPLGAGAGAGASPRLRLSFRRHLLLTFMAVLALALVGSAIGMTALARVQDATSQMVSQRMAAERLVADAYRLQAINAERLKAVALSSEPEVGEVLGADIQATQERFDQLRRQITKAMPWVDEQARLTAIDAAVRNFATARKELVTARDYGLTERIRKVYAERFLPASNALLEALAELARSQRDAIDADAARIASTSRQARVALAAFGLAALVLGLILSIWLTRRITLPLRAASNTAERVADLDLRHPISGHARDEAGWLLAAIGRMQASLLAMVRQVHASARLIQGTCGNIVEGNTHLSSRTDQAASNLQASTAALIELTERVRDSAQAAAQAELLAGSAAQLTQAGGEVMNQVVDTMQAISVSSHRIMDIIGVIDTIAVQSNLLALNAAVEASLAGSQGQGFAVVAAEVRQLAARSTDAAREIKALIHASVQAVDDGVRQVSQAGRSVSGIIKAIQGVAASVAHITATTQVQHRDIAQITDALAQLDRMTQDNAALVEQSAVASANLGLQARALADLVSRFTLPEQTAQKAAANELPAGQVPRAGSVDVSVAV